MSELLVVADVHARDSADLHELEQFGWIERRWRREQLWWRLGGWWRRGRALLAARIGDPDPFIPLPGWLRFLDFGVDAPRLGMTRIMKRVDAQFYL